MSVLHPPKKRQSGPWLFRPDNFTPPTRTPWGGHNIANRLKAGILEVTPAGVVGESWELSVEPDFPSVGTDGVSLGQRIAVDPGYALGAAYPNWSSTALLVKLLDASAPLSVQIHPDDDYERLGPDEGGKPEAWYVVHHEPGAGLYVGFRHGVTRDAVEAALRDGGDLTPMLHFVPVTPGDFFVIRPGTVHAIGPGCTLVEPQRVLPGRRGLTYRYWDWNRRYDENGRESPDGAPRELHVDDALAVTDWAGPREGELMVEVHRRAPTFDAAAPATCLALAGYGDGLQSDALLVARLSGTGTVDLPDWSRLRGLTVVAGRVVFPGSGVEVLAGQTAAVPAGLGAPRVTLDGAHAVLSAAR